MVRQIGMAFWICIVSVVSGGGAFWHKSRVTAEGKSGGLIPNIHKTGLAVAPVFKEGKAVGAVGVRLSIEISSSFPKKDFPRIEDEVRHTAIVLLSRSDPAVLDSAHKPNKPAMADEMLAYLRSQNFNKAIEKISIDELNFYNVDVLKKKS